MKRLEESGFRKWVMAVALVLILFLGFPLPSAADSIPTNKVVRSAVEKALKKLNSPMVEIIAQGSWISNINYRDPRFQQLIEGASDHDMRPFFRSLNISDDAALEVWKKLRMNVMEELKALVSQGIIKADELAVIRNSINIYPPEQLMKGVQTSEEAVALFGKWGIYPSLAEVGKEGSQGSYGALLKFERQGYETGERAVVLFLDKGEVRAGSADLNHMLEGHGPRTAEAMAKAAEDNLADAMKAAKAGNLKDTQKYTKRAAKYLEEAKKKLRSKANANDSALRELQSKLDDLLQKFEAPETVTGLLSEKVLAKTAEGAAAQKQILGEFSKTAENAEKILQEAADDSLLAQKLGKVIEESKPPKVGALFRGLLEGTGKWAAARTQVTKALPTLTDYAKKIGFLNALVAYWTIKDLPEIYVKEGASKAAARFSMSLATMAVPELALGELVALIATTVAEVAVDYVAGFGYQAVTSTQDCFDLIAGVYTVYGRESQIVGDGLKKCHQVNSIRDLACDVYDKEDVGGYLLRTGKLDPKGIPSEMRSLIACHAENASSRFDQETKTDKGVEEALIAKCTGPIISAWLEGRGLAIEEVQALLYDVDKSELRISYDTTAALVKGDATQVSFVVTAALLPPLGDLPDQINAKAACPGGRGSKPYVYQNWTWKVDGSRVTGASGQSLDVTFDKPGSKSICVEWGMEYGVLNTASTLPPPGLSGKILKSGCVKVTAGEELEADKMVVTITGPNKSKAPEKGETGREIALSADIKSKRDPKEFECRWTLEGGYGKSTDANDDRYQAVRYDSAGTYTIKVEVYDRSDVWKVKEIKSGKLAEAVHKITVEPSVKDAKIEAKVSGPSQATVGDTIELAVEVIADERIKAKLKPPVWFMQPGGIMIVAPSDEDPMNEVQTRESIGRGPKASYKTTASGRHDFSVSLYGEGVNGAVTGASHRVDVNCRKTDKGDQCRLEDGGQKAPLSVEIIADRTNVNTGETVNLSAVAKGGYPVYHFTWSGAAQGQGMDTSFVASATKRTANVEAKDQKGQTAKSSVAIAVDKPPVLVEGLKEKAVFGTSQALRVPLEAGNTVLWQSSPTVAFKVLESTDGTTTVTFDRMGKVKVWAEMRTKKGEVFETVNSSDPVEVAVTAPDGKIEFDPASQVTGKQVTAEVKTDNYLGSSLVRYVWLSPPTSNREELTPDKIRFAVPDRKGIPIEVEVRATRSDDTVLSLKRTFDPDGKSGATEVFAGDDAKTSQKRKEIADLLAKAKEAVAAGKLDEGITLAGKAAGLDPSNAEAIGTEKRWQTEKQTVTEASQKARIAADGENFTEAEKHLSGAQGLHPRYQPVVDAEAYVRARKEAHARKIAMSNAQLDKATKEVHLGKLDDAEQSASEAVRINPKNTEAAKYIDFIRKEKQTTNRAVDEVRKLIDDCKFPEAQNALIPIKNKYPYYPPVEQMDPLLSSAWFKWDGRVKEALGAVHMANERKEFATALDLITKARTEIKPDRYANEQLAQQEEWAKRWKAQKDRQIGVLKAAGVQVRNYDYAGALKSYDEGFANGQNIYNGAEPEYKEAVELRNQAFTKNKRLNELIPWVRKAAEDKEYVAVEVLQNYLKTADESIALQPTNGQLKQWHAQIVSRIEKTKADNERLAQGRRHLDAAGGAERGYLTNESSLKAGQITWGEKLEEQQHIYLATAIENYRASLKYIPDGAVEKQIRELETTLEGRKKYLENYRLSVQLRNEADALASQAYKEPDFEKSLPLYDQAAEKYRKSLALYRPGSAEMMEKQIWNLEYGKHDRMVKKYWADGQALEKQGNIVGALAPYDRAIASFHPTVPQMDRMWAVSHAQDLRNRITGAKTWRVDGEAKQKAGKIAEAIASYRQSLKLLPDAPLEEYVRMLEGRQTEANEKKAAADRLWQEGTALFNQGRLSDALGKFKESLGYWSDNTRTKYAADIEARRNRAASLREEGARLQGQNRITEALAKYRESMSLWPDTALSSHMATLEAKLKEEVDTAARKAKAKQLRDEGYALQQKDQLQAAIGKYRESLAAWPDKQLEDYIRQLEVKIASAPPKIPVGAGAVPSRDILTSKVWQFCRSDGTVLASKMRLLPDGRIEGAAHSNESRWGVLGNELFLYDSAGKAATRCNSFRQVGGRWEISGPFLLWGNITHVLREVGEGGGPPAPPPTVTSAPPAPSASWSGTWNADPGPGGEVVTFLLTHTGAKITGTFQAEVPYTGVSGAKQNKSLRGAIDGNVSGSRVTGSYRDTSDWHLAGNFEFTMAAGGNLFTAVVRGEDVNATYTVRRIGAAASVKTSGSAAPVATSGAASSRTVAAEITNQSRENTHVFTEAESFGPQNRLAPGEKRKVTVTMKADGSVVFKAGRNGQVMATKTWRGIPGDPSRVPVVVFDDTNPFEKLLVTTGLR